jgi:LysM repeat protein
MPRPTPRSPRRSAGALIAVLLGLALVASAGAPGLITVKRGDTLSEIAARHGTTVAALKAANGRSGSTIYAGETLRIPGSRTAATKRTRTVEVLYTVRPGDTVTSIARRSGTSIRAITHRNSLSSAHQIRIGQRLVVLRTVRTVGRSGVTTVTVSSGSVSASAARHRRQLRSMDLPSKARARTTVASTARRYGVPVPMALAVAFHESGFQQRVVSGVDAIGVMQVLPRTGRNLSRQAGRDLDLLDYRDNITAGVLLLRQLLRSEGSQRAALAGYYQGVGSIARKGLLPQTHSYIRSIEILKKRFAHG